MHKHCKTVRMVYQNALQCIGNTPIVRLNRVGGDCVANLYAKLEFMNPGGSVKDRIGYYLIEDAEKRGLLKPGGTVVEATSGNTGVGLGMAAAIKGYQCVFVLPDKMSTEKINFLRSFGAEVVVTPAGVEPEDPRSHYSVARKIAKDTPNSFLTNQYDNLANREAHYTKTGPEIWEQFPEIDVMVAGMGTGGTLCGTGKFLKEKNPAVKLVCVDPIGSIIFDVWKHGKPLHAPAPYRIEGIGEDFIPKNFDLSIIDDVVPIEDKESFLMARDLLHKEGLFAGISAGGAVYGAIKWAKQQGEKARNKNILIVLPDSGDRYMSKIWSDRYLSDAQFIDQKNKGLKPLRIIEGAKSPEIF